MTHGGKRLGAGRKVGTGKYKEPTRPVRIPESRIESVLSFLEETEGYKLPMYASTVQAGFPSPADDYITGKIDLNQQLIKRPASTFFVRVAGESMKDAGINDGDLLIVDRSLEAKVGKIVIAVVNGELTVKRLRIENGKGTLMPENPDFDPIDVTEDSDFKVWGVVTNVIHSV